MEKLIEKLQSEEKAFLSSKCLVLNNVVIQPKEIEAYYYKEGEFEDKSVHRNELQQNNKEHFYVHRNGLKKESSYKGGNRSGVDFVVSDEDNVYYSYLIRCAVVNGELVVGPHKVLEAIKKHCHFNSYDEIENKQIEVKDQQQSCAVLFSERINLSTGFVDCELRAILCDEYYKESTYRGKEAIIVDYLLKEVKKGLSAEQAREEVKKYLTYVPSKIKQL